MQSSFMYILFTLLALAVISLQALPLNKRGYSIQLRSGTEFCSFVPPHAGDDVGGTENDGIPMCTSSSLGGQQFPAGFIQSAHYLSTSNYVQVTGRIDRTKYNLKSSDGGGQYDNKDISGVTCNGYKYFVNLIEPDANQFCIRCCKNQSDCRLGISTAGCETIVPGNYS
ncbi:hypothetical protein G6F70_000868 [Rhizopus microsporus]|uniref:Secreted protein n=2 Tax=Rhizopus TaxID=4842 RepID=A0A367K8T1_RHIAZ|nr:hypothetical protein G6F71_000584 [Rhizopus microsporus]RCH98577.1 hypothetical protein CU097_010942 [Rhizopus azygosporus]KAG1204035.1 hypothetical protein G6F70_000868 [Rhizopus microsporus]KAG1214987.1 hypothetical protein G6F69_001453 [Rhizopus microsporus]KAG1237392.1 hypothetical protein G6F67_001221 [Rhizopus microsporus]